MRDRPAGVTEDRLRHVLAEGWHLRAAALRYAPVGGGSYHWVLRDSQGGRWFVTVDDLDDKPWLGDSRAAVSAGLGAAMDTAFALRYHAGLRFVAAPVPAVHGRTVLPVGSQYAVTVFPFIDGASGQFGGQLPPGVRHQLVDMLAALHKTAPAATRAAKAQVLLPGRGIVESALSELGRPWRGGPFSEPARELLASTTGHVRRLLETFDRLAGHVAAAPETVLTHGEPHPGNVIQAGQDTMLIDWDTVGLAPPERDLWLIVTDTGREARRYTEATGRAVDPAALAFYRLRWALDDISYFVPQLRARHHRTPHTEHIWLGLQEILTGTSLPVSP